MSVAFFLIYYIAIPIWIIWGIYATYLTNRIFKKDLKYLFNPDVNVFAENNSCSRYDQIRTKQWKVTIGAIFFMPLRILGFIIMLPGGLLLALIFYYGFCSKKTC